MFSKLRRDLWHEFYILKGDLTREESNIIKKVCDFEIKWGVDK